MSSSSTRTAVSHPTLFAMASYEDSDEAEDTINVAPIDLTSSVQPVRASREVHAGGLFND